MTYQTGDGYNLMLFRREWLSRIFRPYELLVMEYLWERKEEDLTTGSGKVWKEVNDRLPEGKTMSRATYIFFLNRMVDAKWNGHSLLDWKDATGKGGHHRQYFATMTKQVFLKKVYNHIGKMLNSEFV